MAQEVAKQEAAKVAAAAGVVSVRGIVLSVARKTLVLVLGKIGKNRLFPYLTF